MIICVYIYKYEYIFLIGLEFQCFHIGIVLVRFNYIDGRCMIMFC